MIDKIFPKPIEAIKMTGFPFGERFMGTGILTGMLTIFFYFLKFLIKPIWNLKRD